MARQIARRSICPLSASVSFSLFALPSPYRLPSLFPSCTPKATPPIFTTIDVPGASETDANDVNTAGTVVGFSVDSAGSVTGFSLSNGTFTNIAFPGATLTLVYGINDGGVTVGLVR